ncbi:SseB family protein [Frigoribacterium salinisoli]
MGLFSRKDPARTTDDGGSGGATPGAGADAPGPAVVPGASGPAGPGVPGPTAARLTSAGLTTADAHGAPGWDVTPGSLGGAVQHGALQAALAVWARQKDSVTFSDVLRELAAGDLLLDIGSSTLADRSAGLQRGDVLAVAHQVDSAGERVLLAFTDAQRLARYRGTVGDLSLAQPAVEVAAQAVAEYGGLALDPGSPDTQFIAHADELVSALGDDVRASGPVKRALAERDQPWPEVLELLRGSPSLWTAELEQQGDRSGVADVDVGTVTGEHGETWSVLHSSPAEVRAWAPGASALRVAFAEVAASALGSGHAGVVVNPRGPSVLVVADELRALVARD